MSKTTQPETGNPHYLAILDEMRAMHLRKAHDYGLKGDPLSNLRASAQFGIEPWVGCMLRANDKVTRVQALLQKGNLLNESLEDSLLDIAAYAILALTLLREEPELALPA